MSTGHRLEKLLFLCEHKAPLGTKAAVYTLIFKSILFIKFLVSVALQTGQCGAVLPVF